MLRPPALGLLTLESAKKIIKNVSTLPGPVPLLRLRRPGPVPRQVDRRGPRAPHPRARRPPGALLDRGPALERVARAAAGPGGADRGVHRQHRPGGVGVPGARGRAGAWTGARPRGGDSGSGELESLGYSTFFSFSPPPLFFCSGFGSRGVFESGTREQKKSSLFGTHLSLALLLRKTGAREAEGKRERCRCRCRGVPRRCGRRRGGGGRGRRAATGPRRRLNPAPALFFPVRPSPPAPLPGSIPSGVSLEALPPFPALPCLRPRALLGPSTLRVRHHYFHSL